MKEEWKKVKLCEICKSISDGDHLPPPKSNFGIPFVTIANIKGNQFDFSNTMFVPESYYEKLDSKRRAQTDDILYSVVGSFGIPVLQKNNSKFVFQRHIAILRPAPEKVNPQFLFYTMLGREFYAKADAVAVGAAQRTVSLTSLRNIEVTLPSLLIQQKIASILSAYDDLIENNRKQIKLLEEAAQKLYKEWFVKLNFPGHETTKIVDGIPEGWKTDLLSSLGVFKRGKVITRAQASKGNVPVVAGGIDPAYYTNKANTLSPVITISASGNAGFVRLYNCEVWASDCSYLDKTATQYLYYVYTYLKVNQTVIYSLQKGACQQHVSPKDINELELLVPTDEMINKFEHFVAPIYQKTKTLQNQNQQLQSARDKLLPKLVNGEFDL